MLLSTLGFLTASVLRKQRSQSPSTTCTHEVYKLTLNTLRKCFDPGIHFNKFNVGEDFIHLLDTVICGSYTFSPEICSDPGYKHLKGKRDVMPNHSLSNLGTVYGLSGK